ncbi:MAG: choline ABC transporter substrate-binding protein [Candidatus Tokpelaia sp.]|uniref:choline ABC transporter substrate-binding protein n=1 Tax=Candidatus Tokpelaia sp. TaxID=2233777 RepID=UPI00123965FF|nr:choline ABC transporter substrate-binding protein [Candidatus Tokpelaia sp.]KAA6204335.1 MAG: choline ABC transporter substrate-binding protein [Candidatus Tokpelaia sp.]KAA6205064.1 MAG: choline ABC transporter substrate-binding protein [Candidatus Tokpelaia sp.]KAA6404581.1 glycine/betaine ABC transporter substrate-binding protein [Candidatus Tokpelaia sp.]
MAVFLTFINYAVAAALPPAVREGATRGPEPGFEPQACATVRLAETGWTDIAVTTAIATRILQSLGYETQTRLLSVPVTFSAMSTGEIDIFLGFWQPSMTADIKPYLDRGEVHIVRSNLQDARYGLAVPDYAYAAGLRRVEDIARFAGELGDKIYGIEPGNDANRLLLAMIEANKDGLGKFQLVESSEPAMLAEVAAAIADSKPIVFLAWQPHPMNRQFRLAYLAGGEARFGAGNAGASVSTVVRRNYDRQCPNIGRFLQNLSFSLVMENNLMDKILGHGEEPDSAVRAWLGSNPPVLAEWLAGVKSRSGAPALPLVQKAFTAR